MCVAFSLRFGGPRGRGHWSRHFDLRQLGVVSGLGGFQFGVQSIQTFKTGLDRLITLLDGARQFGDLLAVAARRGLLHVGMQAVEPLFAGINHALDFSHFFFQRPQGPVLAGQDLRAFAPRLLLG